ncbi:SEC-C metal-binding domain-containing protein [Pseudomonas helleri]
MTALGRNDPCWCKSGKKYKNCHLNMQSLPSVKPHVVTQALSSLNRTKTCSVPDSLRHECSSKIIKA